MVRSRAKGRNGHHLGPSGHDPEPSRKQPGSIPNQPGTSLEPTWNQPGEAGFPSGSGLIPGWSGLVPGWFRGASWSMAREPVSQGQCVLPFEGQCRGPGGLWGGSVYMPILAFISGPGETLAAKLGRKGQGGPSLVLARSSGDSWEPRGLVDPESRNPGSQACPQGPIIRLLP